MKRYSIQNGSQIIDYEVTHRPAVTRRIHLEINKEGNLQVVAPRRMSRRDVQKTLQQKVRHVARFLLQARARQRDLPQFFYVNGEEHLFMGQRYPLEILERNTRWAGVELSDDRIRVILPEPGAEKIRSKLENWYREQAREHFQDRLMVFSQAAPWTGAQAPPMRLRRMKRTWGSCSSGGVITLNPHLVKAPPECIDYVIAHEVCHLEQHNHGKAFYTLQEQLYPHWHEAKARLTASGHIYLHV